MQSILVFVRPGKRHRRQISFKKQKNLIKRQPKQKDEIKLPAYHGLGFLRRVGQIRVGIGAAGGRRVDADGWHSAIRTRATKRIVTTFLLLLLIMSTLGLALVSVFIALTRLLKAVMIAAAVAMTRPSGRRTPVGNRFVVGHRRTKSCARPLRFRHANVWYCPAIGNGCSCRLLRWSGLILQLHVERPLLSTPHGNTTAKIKKDQRKKWR